MIKNILALSIGMYLLAACGGSSTTEHNTAQGDTLFTAYSNAFIEHYWQHNPEGATSSGYHNFDSLLTINSDESIAERLNFNHKWLDSLLKFEPEQLSALNQIDYQLIKNQLEKSIWKLETEKSHTWDPAQYNVGEVFALTLHEPYAPLEQKVRSFYERLKKVPAYFAAARAVISNPVQELRLLAIDQNLGGLSIFKSDFRDSVAKLNIPEAEKTQMLAASESAVAAITAYTSWLTQLKPEQPRSFRLGKELYENAFRYYIQSDLSAAEMYEVALKRKNTLHEEMAKLSRQLWSKYFAGKPMPSDSLAMIRAMIDTLSTQHATPAGFQAAIEQQIPLLIKFINEKNLIYLDPAKPLVVRKEPAYMAGVAGASISAPGPYDKEGNTYYNVGSLEGWPAAKAESYLREYNDYILQILNIHEAIPGHYTQLVYANKSPSLIKSIFGNGAMIEGWAVYTEQMMLENGYGNNAPEMWLMWYKWHLRTVCNTILDYSVHVLSMERQQGIDLLTKEAFQQQAEAEGKWKRVSVTSVQLCSYYSGYKEIYDLREAYRQKKGSKFNLKAFHEQFLGYGSAPVKYIRRNMMDQK